MHRIEPPINRDPNDLDAMFWHRLSYVLAQLKVDGTPFVLHEGFRTVERQRWLYGQGRPAAKYGRPGKKVTDRDGVTKQSDHQAGFAADCYPCHANGKIIWPPPPSDPTEPDCDPRWERYAALAEAQGLTAGYRWKSPHDPPHVEMRKGKQE